MQRGYLFCKINTSLLKLMNRAFFRKPTLFSPARVRRKCLRGKYSLFVASLNYYIYNDAVIEAYPYGGTVGEAVQSRRRQVARDVCST